MWEWLPWVRRRARRAVAQALAEAQAAQEREHQEAVQRILTAGRRRNEGPEWLHATMPLPTLNRPLMTPAQKWRDNGGRQQH
jgi:hypothetical protein